MRICNKTKSSFQQFLDPALSIYISDNIDLLQDWPTMAYGWELYHGISKPKSSSTRMLQALKARTSSTFSRLLFLQRSGGGYVSLITAPRKRWASNEYLRPINFHAFPFAVYIKCALLLFGNSENLYLKISNNSIHFSLLNMTGDFAMENLPQKILPLHISPPREFFRL